MDMGQRTATLEAQMDARKDADTELRGAVESLGKRIDGVNKRVWGILLLLFANLISRLVPGIDKVLP